MEADLSFDRRKQFYLFGLSVYIVYYYSMKHVFKESEETTIYFAEEDIVICSYLTNYYH